MCCDLGDETDSLRRFIKIHPSNNSDAAVTRDRPKSKTKVDICLFTFGIRHSLYCTSLVTGPTHPKTHFKLNFGGFNMFFYTACKGQYLPKMYNTKNGKLRM